MTEKIPSRPPPAGLSLSLADIYHIFFRHKWKIALISAAGVLAALLLPFFMPVAYQSEAKLYIRYVLESKSPTQTEANDPRIKSPDARGDSIINTEMEILTSLDLAQQVADTIGPEKILGPGNTNSYYAGAVVRKSLTAEVPKNSSVIRLTFQHSNPDIVQPVLSQLIALYLKKHTQIHAVGAYDDFLTEKTDQLRSDILRTEQELERAKTNLGLYSSVEEAKHFLGEQISRTRQAIFDAEAELGERKAAANELAGTVHAKPTAATNESAAPSSEKVAEYKKLCSQLDNLRKKEQEYLQIYAPESSLLKSVQQQIGENAMLKRQLEEKNPELVAIGILESRRAEAGPNPRTDLATEMARVIALDSKITVLNEHLEKLQKESTTVNAAEGNITKLQIQKDLQQGRYKHFVQSLEQARNDEQIGASKDSNISPIQNPSPPFRDSLKLQKARLMVLSIGIVVALGLAFLIEIFLDRSLKRSTEFETKVGLPLFLSIPLIHQNGSTHRLNWRRKVPQLGRGVPETNGHANDGNGEAGAIVDESDIRHSNLDTRTSSPATPLNGHSSLSTPHSNGHIGPWDARHVLRPFFEALRDRLIGYFEIKNLTHKPKLVAVTSCGEGAGVTTIAAGLAASLSETGDGNVLLVDMNLQNGAAHHFYKGNLDCGLDDALEIEKRSSALVQDHLYVVSESTNGNGDKVPRVLPRRFTNLIPRLKASDYDYIIFDMPPINQISVTPRLAHFMDAIFLIVESEKTDRDIVKRATVLLADSKSNICAILNKSRTYVPKLLQQEI